MKSNITPESDFDSPSSLASSSLASCVSPPPFSYRSYQRDDLARAAMHNGAIIGWDPGLGKTMAIFSLPFLKKSAYTLIVAPGGLHEQIADEGRQKFGLTVTPIPDQETALRLIRQGILPFPGQPHPVPPSEPRFFITSYTALGYNGADEWAGSKETNDLIRARRLSILLRTIQFPDATLAAAMAEATWKHTDRISDFAALSLPPGSTPDRIRTALRTAAMLFHPIVQPDCSDTFWRWYRIHNAATTLLGLSSEAAARTVESFATDPAVLHTGDALRLIEEGIGHERDIGPADQPHVIRCVFAPTLASIVTAIFDCVVCDEAVRLKSGTSYQAQGILRMSGSYRYALTGTPIKNKLPDLFYLASWVTGHTSRAIARWPYGNNLQARGQFSKDFGVLEQNLTKQELALSQGKAAPPPKTTNQICNVHRLWRILGPVVIRRRKDDVPDCDIVKKTTIPIRVMPGTTQNAVYRYHLAHPPEKKTPLASIGAQLQNLRQAALNPSSAKLTHGGQHGRSHSVWTPKYTAILKLAADLLSQGEQLVIFSPFQDFSTSLAARFRDAAVPHLVLDGNLTPAKRGSLIKKFKSGEIPILIAGIDSMGEGYSLDNARHLVLPSLSWSFDSNTQAVERVHRLTSRRDVSIYVMVTQGTIDERLCSIWQEKGDSSDLALDGRLITSAREEIDLGTLLRDAVKDFDPKAPTLDEDEVALHWKHELSATLAAAGKTYLATPATTPAKPRRIPATATLKPAAFSHRPPAEKPQTSTPPPRRTLFDLMKTKPPTPSTPQATAPIPPPEPAAEPAPGPAPIPAPEPAPTNIITFPGRLGTLIPTRPRVRSLAEILSQ
jgi:hypothetical protein